MRKVAVIGIGQTKIEEHWDKSLKLLAGEALLLALADANRETVEGIFVGNMMSGSASHQQHLGAMVADWVGIRHADAAKVESACGSGAAAFRAGLMAVASGQLESAAIVGVEKMTDSPGDEITGSLATAADADWEALMGLSFVALNALLMRRYMHQFNWQHEAFANFSINAHANGTHNPYARFQEPITLDVYNKAPMIAEPINLFDASPMGDGAAAAIIVPQDQALQLGNRLVTVIGSASATDTVAVHSRKDPTWLTAAEISAKQAYTQAGIGPESIDFFELHDAFTIMSALSLEAAGFAERGQGPRLALDNEIAIHGRIPISTRGGLKARGHPVGGTGMYQLVETVQQLRGEAGATQVPHARIGMTQNIGGSGSNIIAHILKAGQ